MTSTLISNPELTTGITSYRLIRESRAAKLGLRSSGQIVFQILTDDSLQDLFVRIAANEGGGYASDEAVSVHALVRCITDLETGGLLRSGTFKSAFVGRSANNSGFITAVLLAEGLLSRDAERPHLLIDNGRWNDWCATQLAVSGDLPVVRVGKEVAAVVDTPMAASDADVGYQDHGAEINHAALGVADPAQLPAGGEVPVEPEHGKPGRKARKGHAVESV